MVARRIYQWAERQPNKIAFIHNDTNYSYAAFARNIEAVRTFFGRWALPVGQTAIILADNFAHAWFLMLGLRALGLNTICVNSIGSAEKLQIKSLACVVVTRAEHAAHGSIGQLAVGAPLFVFQPEPFEAAASGAIPSWPESTPAYGGHILYTSGTTSQYKKVLMDGLIEDARNERWSSNLGATENTVYHNLYLPPWTAVGFDFPSCVWHEGGCVIIDQSNDMYSRVGERKCDLIFATSAMLGLMLQARADGARKIGSVRLAVGGGPLSKAMAERAAATFTDWITAIYGATEHHNCMMSELENGEDAAWLKPVVDGVFEIVDEHGAACAHGAEGYLRVRLSPVDPWQYLDDAEATKRFFRNGYFYPGDLAVRDADGRIRILGRVGDVLNIQGAKVAVAPLEQKVQMLLGVDNVCLFGTLNSHGAEELVVAIEARRVPPQDDLQRVARDFMQFQTVRFHVLPAFPRTEAGMQKVNRAKLRGIVFGPSRGPPKPG
jgi:acyl-coenzyme A synthetase/AMP-(fatty) acid ligase